MLEQQEEQELYYVVKGRGGSFKTALFELICKADSINLEKLRLGFPAFVDAVYHYQNKRGYWEELEQRIENEHKENRC